MSERALSMQASSPVFLPALVFSLVLALALAVVSMLILVLC